MKQENMTHIEREILAKIHPWMIKMEELVDKTHWKHGDYNCFPHVNKLEESLNL